VGHIAGSSGTTLNGLAGDHGDNPIRRLDPRSRIVAALLFAVAVVALTDFLALGTALGLGIVALIMARLPFASTFRRVAAMDGFIVFMLIMLPFTTPGAALFTLGPLTATEEGLLKAITIALKANAIVMVLLALVGTVEATVLGHALHRLKVPENLVHLLLFTVRYIEVLGQEYRRLRTAMHARGFQPGNNLHTYRSIGYLLGMMLVRSLERSERILEAMKCRGFHGRLFLLDSFRYSRHDHIFAGVSSLMIGLLFMLEYRDGWFV
jgi:cobalt/nickel transport system permease protein